MTSPTLSRRSFLATAAAGAAALTRPWSPGDQERPPFPFVDGLCALPQDLSEIGRSGLSAFILDVSSVAAVETDDGTVRYYRSFDASV
ncbi:twin-arginine translocation signal domain-containing protein, partial [Gemmatimonadota bacterium]